MQTSCPKGSFVVVVQPLSCVQLFVTPWTAACQAPLSFTISRSLLKFMSTESVMKTEMSSRPPTRVYHPTW